MIEPLPRIAIESAHPPDLPALTSLAGALRDAGFQVDHSYPQEQRSAEHVTTFVALRLLDTGVTLAIGALSKRIVIVTRQWMHRNLESLSNEGGGTTPTVALYGVRGEVLSEITIVADDDRD
jgi:hypothetical protein